MFGLILTGNQYTASIRPCEQVFKNIYFFNNNELAKCLV